MFWWTVVNWQLRLPSWSDCYRQQILTNTASPRWKTPTHPSSVLLHSLLRNRCEGNILLFVHQPTGTACLKDVASAPALESWLSMCVYLLPPHPPPYSDSQQKDEVCHLTEEELFSDTGAFYFQKNRLLLQDSFISKTVFVPGLPGQDPFPGDCAAPSFWWQTPRCLDPAGSSEDPGGTLTVPGPLLPTPPLWSIASLWRTLHTHT